MAVSAGECPGLQSDPISSTFHVLHEPPFHPVLFPLITIRDSEVLVRLLPCQQGIRDSDDSRSLSQYVERIAVDP